MGFQIGSPNTTVDAEVTAIPMNEYNVIATGRPNAWPTICDPCDFAYRVKSGIFNDSVAQYPTIAVSEGKKKCRKLSVVWNSLGAARIGPNPPALCTIQKSSPSDITSKNGAEKLCRCRIDSTPRHTTTMFSSQKPRKHVHNTPGIAAEGGQITLSIA